MTSIIHLKQKINSTIQDPLYFIVNSKSKNHSKIRAAKVINTDDILLPRCHILLIMKQVCIALFNIYYY